MRLTFTHEQYRTTPAQDQRQRNPSAFGRVASTWANITGFMVTVVGSLRECQTERETNDRNRHPLFSQLRSVDFVPPRAVTATPPPGWYPDPSGKPDQRFWDGNAWAPEGSPQAQQAIKKTKRWPWVIGVIAALVVVVALSGNGPKDGTDNDSANSIASMSSPVAALGDDNAATGVELPAADGMFDFVVTGIDHASTIGDGIWQEEAKGEFVIVRLNVTNTGDEARTFFSGNQHLIVNGNKYDATTVVGGDVDSENINPGLGIDTSVTFDVPLGSQADAIELHDSMFSGGVTVNLR
jgi:hypothetical protein